MKKLILLVLAAVLLFSGCSTMYEKNFVLPSLSVAITEEPEISNTPEQNSELINSLVRSMQLNKAKNSVAGFTYESTFGEVLDKAEEGKINTVFLTYYYEFAGYPAVAKYVFRNINDDIAMNTDVGKLPLCFMLFDVIQDKDNIHDVQLKELIDSMDVVLGEHSADEESGFYKWENESYHIRLSTDYNVAPGSIAQVSVIAPPETALPNLLPYAFGTDIETVYRNEMCNPLPEYYSNDSYSYYLNYDEGGTSFAFFFSVRDSELKLSSAGFQTNLYDIEIKDIGNCLVSFGDRMEVILGPADSRSSISSDKKPRLMMEWPGLEIKAYDLINDETYSIFINFSEDYFLENEIAEN